MERIQAGWQEHLINAWKDMLEVFPVPAFIAVSGDEPLANSALKALLPVKDGFTAEIEAAAPVYAPLRMVSFIQNGHKTRELEFDIFSVPAFTETGHRTVTLGLKRTQGGKPEALMSFATCLLKFYGTDYMPRAIDMLNVLPVGAAIVDEHGKYQYVSRSLAVWNGVSAVKMQEMSVADFSDGAVSDDLLAALVSGDVSSIEWNVEKDGGDTMFSAVYSHSPGLLAQVAALAGDDDARESAGEAMEKKKKLEASVNRSGVVIFVIQPNRDWDFTYVSQNIERFGISRDTETSARLGEHIADFESFKSRARGALANCRHYSDVFNLISDNGTVFRVASNMRIVNADGGVRIEGSFTDITPLETLKHQVSVAHERLNSQTDGAVPNDLTDILSIDFLQEHQDRFAEVFMLPAQIFNPMGREITKSYGNCMECSALCGISSNRMCRLWSAAVSKLKEQPGEVAVVSCPNSMVTASFFPIYVGTRLSAVWKSGSVLLEQMSYDDIFAVNERFNGNIHKTGHIIHDLPRSMPQTFNLAVETLSIMSRNISAFATSCIKLARDVGVTEGIHSEVEELLERADLIADCVQHVSSDGHVHGLMDSIGKTFEFDRLCVYTECVLSDEWLADGVRPTATREYTPKLWAKMSEKGGDSRDNGQTVRHLVWFGDKLYAVVCAERCLVHRELSQSDYDLLELMLSAVGGQITARRLKNDGSSAVAKLEKELEGMTVLDYNTRSVIYPSDCSFESDDIPYDELIDDDGRISAPVTWKSDGIERKASAFYWYDGRLAVLVK